MTPQERVLASFSTTRSESLSLSLPRLGSADVTHRWGWGLVPSSHCEPDPLVNPFASSSFESSSTTVPRSRVDDLNRLIQTEASSPNVPANAIAIPIPTPAAAGATGNLERARRRGRARVDHAAARGDRQASSWTGPVSSPMVRSPGLSSSSTTMWSNSTTTTRSLSPPPVTWWSFPSPRVRPLPHLASLPPPPYDRRGLGLDFDDACTARDDDIEIVGDPTRRRQGSEHDQVTITEDFDCPSLDETLSSSSSSVFVHPDHLRSLLLQSPRPRDCPSSTWSPAFDEQQEQQEQEQPSPSRRRDDVAAGTAARALARADGGPVEENLDGNKTSSPRPPPRRPRRERKTRPSPAAPTVVVRRNKPGGGALDDDDDDDRPGPSMSSSSAGGGGAGRLLLPPPRKLAGGARHELLYQKTAATTLTSFVAPNFGG